MAIAAQRYEYAPPIDTVSVTKGSLFKRIVAALIRARELQANREIARYAHLIESSNAFGERASSTRRKPPAV